MISLEKKTILKWAVAVLAFILVIGCSSQPKAPSSDTQKQNNTTTSGTLQQDTATSTQPTTNTNTTPDSSTAPAKSIVYKNNQYGFSFTLPADWQGYTIVSAPWEGLAVKGDAGEAVVESGPIVAIRDPRWTTKTPRQDIPIMVFTLDQWNSLQQGVFHIGAAPIGPRELGRNNVYVFALPARYNFAFPPGYQEVETILAGNPLHTTQTTQQHPDATESLLFNMMIFGEQGKVLYCDFAAQNNSIEDVQKAWGKADKTEYVATAKGNYATYSSHKVVFGINKGEQIFEVRSYDNRLAGVTLAQVKRVLGAPAYDATVNGQEIIGYTTNSEFKVEMVFPQPTKAKSNPVMDHYNVLYPAGTVNSMADDSGRQW